MSAPWSRSRVLALDTTSPLLSVAVGSHDQLIAERTAAASRSSAAIMRLLDDCLVAAGLTIDQIEALLVLRGPGSFTGLRVGLALAQGLQQALALPVGTLGTLQVLAAAPVDPGRVVLSAVGAGRRTWLVQKFSTGEPRRAEEDPRRCSDSELLRIAASEQVVGFGLESLSEADRSDTSETDSGPKGHWTSPPPLAGLALGQARDADWNLATLTEPIYLAPPPADPRARREV